MKFSRKVMMSAAATVLPLGLLSFVGVQLLSSGPASATPPNIGQARGTLHCTTIKAKVTFTPPIETTGDTNTAKSSTTGTVSGCTWTDTPTGPGTPLPAGSHITGTISESATTTTTDMSANSCGGLVSAGSKPITFTVKWTDKNSSGVVIATLNNTVSTFSGYDAVFNPITDGGTSFHGFDLPKDAGGTASVASGGSFQGTDAGASSNANAYATITVSTIGADCGHTSPDGLPSLTLGHAGPSTDPSQSTAS